MSQSSLRFIVIGAGLGGLCLAQGLRKAGVDVAVYERDAGLTIRMQGHRIHIDSRGEQALRQCLPPSLYELFLATRGQPSKGITVFRIVDGHLQESSTQPFPESGNDEFITAGSAVDRLTLRQILLAGLDDITHFNKTFARYEQQEDGQVCAYFTDGTTACADVLVGACGVGSHIRQQFLPHAQVLDTDMRWLGGKTFLTDEDLQAMGSPALQRTAVELTKTWYPSLSPFTQRADPTESFFLTMRRSVPIEHWQSSLITVTSQGTPLHQALHDYEIGMLHSGFSTVRTSLQAMQERRPLGISFNPNQ
jgi:2-polyprenyl-6-methoxyphenol hydroxylase-like FAD-dependent oxidoreductase